MSSVTRPRLHQAAALAALVPVLASAAGGTDFSDALFLPGDGLTGPSVGMQMQSDIAPGADGFLAVWSDLRTSPDDAPPFASEGSGADIYAARLDAAGAPIGAEPIVIDQAFGDQVNPVAAWDGEHWLVVWQGPYLSYYDRQLLAVRVAPDGTVLEPAPIVLDTAPSQYSSFRVAGGTDGWVVVFQDAGVRAVHVSADGAVMNPGGLLLLNTGFLVTIDVAFAQDEFLVTWAGTFNGAAGRRLAADVEPIDPAPFALPWAGRIASNAADFLVVWHNNNYPNSSVKAARVTHGGAVLDPSGFFVAAGVPYVQEGVDLAWDGMNYWVSWQETASAIKAASVSTAGLVLAPFTIDPPTASIGGVALAGAPAGGVQIVWNDGVSGANEQKDVHSAHLSAGGTIGGAAVLSGAASAQLAADMAEGPGTFMVVFRGRHSGTSRILAQRLDATGAALDSEPIELASGAGVGDPAVAWNGSLYLVTWSDGWSIRGRRLLADGTIVDPAPLAIMPGITPDVAAVGDTFLVVGIDLLFDNPEWQATHSMRVDGSTGALLDPEPSALGGFVIFAQHPHVVGWNDRWLVTWQTNASHDEPSASVRGALVALDGSAGGGAFFVSPGGWRPDVAPADDRALFVWSSGSIASADSNIMGRLMMADGTFVAAEFTVAAAPDRQLVPTVTWNGSQFFAAWQDKRNATAYFDERTDIYGTGITIDGTVLQPAGVPLGAAAAPEIDPALISAGGTTLLAASTFIAAGPFNAYRVGVQVDGLPALPGDANHDGHVDVADLTMVILNWGVCPPPPAGCNGDLDGNGWVDVADLTAVILSWTP